MRNASGNGQSQGVWPQNRGQGWASPPREDGHRQPATSSAVQRAQTGLRYRSPARTRAHARLSRRRRRSETAIRVKPAGCKQPVDAPHSPRTRSRRALRSVSGLSQHRVPAARRLHSAAAALCADAGSVLPPGVRCFTSHVPLSQPARWYSALGLTALPPDAPRQGRVRSALPHMDLASRFTTAARLLNST